MSLADAIRARLDYLAVQARQGDELLAGAGAHDLDAVPGLDCLLANLDAAEDRLDDALERLSNAIDPGRMPGGTAN